MRLTGGRPLAGELAEPRSLATLVLAQQVVGVALGLAWLAWAPSTVSYLLDAGNGTGVVVPGQSEAQVAGDGRYAVLTALAGVAFGLLAWRQRRNRGPVTVVVLVASGVLGSLLALLTGQLLGGGQHARTLNTAFHPGLVLHGTAEVFLQALMAVLVYTIFVGLSGDRQLGRVEDGPAGAESDGLANRPGHEPGYQPGSEPAPQPGSEPAP